MKQVETWTSRRGKLSLAKRFMSGKCQCNVKDCFWSEGKLEAVTIMKNNIKSHLR